MLLLLSLVVRCRLQREADAQYGGHGRQSEDGDDVAAVGLVVVAAAVPQLLLDEVRVGEVEFHHLAHWD